MRNATRPSSLIVLMRATSVSDDSWGFWGFGRGGRRGFRTTRRAKMGVPARKEEIGKVLKEGNALAIFCNGSTP